MSTNSIRVNSKHFAVKLTADNRTRMWMIIESGYTFPHVDKQIT